MGIESFRNSFYFCVVVCGASNPHYHFTSFLCFWTNWYRVHYTIRFSLSPIHSVSINNNYVGLVGQFHLMDWLKMKNNNKFDHLALACLCWFRCFNWKFESNFFWKKYCVKSFNHLQPATLNPQLMPKNSGTESKKKRSEDPSRGKKMSNWNFRIKWAGFIFNHFSCW